MLNRRTSRWLKFYTNCRLLCTINNRKGTYNPNETFDYKMSKNTGTPPQAFQSVLDQGYTPTSKALEKVIIYLAKIKRTDLAIEWLTKIQDFDIFPKTKLFNPVLQLLEAEEAKNFFNNMIDQGILPDITTYNILIKKYIQSKDINSANALINEILNQGYSPNLITMYILMSEYAKQSNYDEIDKILVLIKHFRIKLDTKFLDTLVEKIENIQKSYEYFEKIFEEEGIYLSYVMYGRFLERIIKNPTLENQKISIKLIKKMGEVGKSPPQKIIEELLIHCHDFDEIKTQLINELNEFPKKYFLPHYNKQLQNLLQQKKYEICLQTFKDLCKQKFIPTRFTFSIIMKCFTSKNDLDGAFQLLDQMEEKGFHSNKFVINILLEGLSNDKEKSHVMKEIICKYNDDFSFDSFSLNSLISSALKTSSFWDASKILFENNPFNAIPNGITYNLFVMNIINVKNNKNFIPISKTEKRNQLDWIFNQIFNKTTLKIDSLLYSNLLRAICILKSWDKLNILIKNLKKDKIEINEFMARSLLNAFIQSNDYDNSFYYFKVMVNKRFSIPLWICEPLIKLFVFERRTNDIFYILDTLKSSHLITVDYDFIKKMVQFLSDSKEYDITRKFLFTFADQIPLYLDVLVMRLIHDWRTAGKDDEVAKLLQYMNSVSANPPKPIN